MDDAEADDRVPDDRVPDLAGQPDRRTSPINLPAAAAGLAETWSPRVAGRINEVLVKLARLDGDFVWHNHPDTDEAFLCLSGHLVIELRDGDRHAERSIELRPGDLYVIPRGVDHCPHAPAGATVALFEAAGVVNTGQAGGELTAPVDRPLG
jgi:mannose-6-phosphate isomerase-like protein (cupin superfamily)